MRRFQNSGLLLALSISELDAAEDAGVGSLRWLFENQSSAWRKVDEALEKRRVNRASVGLSRPRRLGDDATSGFNGRGAQQAEEQRLRTQLLTEANRPVAKAIAAADARISAENALVRAVMDIELPPLRQTAPGKELAL